MLYQQDILQAVSFWIAHRTHQVIYVINSNIRMSHWQSPAVLFMKDWHQGKNTLGCKGHCRTGPMVTWSPTGTSFWKPPTHWIHHCDFSLCSSHNSTRKNCKDQVINPWLSCQRAIEQDAEHWHGSVSESFASDFLKQPQTNFPWYVG